MIRHRVALSVLAVAVFALVLQGRRPLWEPDEGRYVAVAVEMLDSGDWLVPHLHPTVEHLTKPPLTYWAIATSLAALGSSELAARLPNGIAFGATILLVWVLAAKLGESQPTRSAVTYATSLGPFVASNIVTTDTLTTLWATGALVGMATVWRAERPSEVRRWGILTWACLGLAMLTKGPPALLVPLFAAAAIVAVGEPGTLRRLTPPLGLAVFAVVGFGWFAMIALHRPGWLGSIVRRELVERIIGSQLGRDPEPFAIVTVYLPALLLGMLPWIVPGLRRLVAALSLRPAGVWQAALRARPSTTILVAAIVPPLLVFGLTRSRMPLYVLPLMPASAILLARSLPLRPSRAAVLAVALWAAALLGLRSAGPALPGDRDARAFAAELVGPSPAPVDEVVVVNDVNRFGLVFYLDCNVEHVALEPSDLTPRTPYRASTLEQELMADHGRRLYLVPQHSFDRFGPEMERLGHTFTVHGRVGKMHVVTVD